MELKRDISRTSIVSLKSLEEGGGVDGVSDIQSTPKNMPGATPAHQPPITGSDGGEPTKGELHADKAFSRTEQKRNILKSSTVSLKSLGEVGGVDGISEPPITGSDGREPTKGGLSSNLVTTNKADRQNNRTIQAYLTAILRNLIQALGASMPTIILILACIPWLKYLGREAFLGLAVLSVVWPMAEMCVVHHLLEERSHLRYVFFLRSSTVIALLITFYLAWNLSLWTILFISEGIQFTTNTIEQHHLTPNSTMTVIAKIRFCLGRAIVYRLHIAFPALMAIGSFYLNSNGMAIADAWHVAITGIAYPVLKSLFVLRSTAYSRELFGEKPAPWPGMEIALQSSLAFPPKLGLIMSFPFNRYFLTTALLSFIARVMIRLALVSAARYSENPGSEKRYHRFAQYINPVADGIKNSITFIEAGECVATICAVVSSLVLSGSDVGIPLIYKILVVLATEVLCNSLAMAEEYQNGWLVDRFPVWVGILPGLFMIRFFGLYLVTRYAVI